MEQNRARGCRGPTYGTATNPVTGGFYVNNLPGDFAVINVGELTASPEGGSGLAPQSVADIVTPGVTAHGTTISVSTETATLVVNGNSSLTDAATLTLIGAYRTPTKIFGPIENNGVMTINNATVEFGALSGNGSINASSDSTLNIQSSDAGNTIQLLSSHLFIGGQGGVAGGLAFLAPMTVTGTSDITLNHTQATSEAVARNGGSLSEVFLYNGATEVADLKIHSVADLYAVNSVSGGSVTLSTVQNSNDLPIVAHAS